MNNAHHNLKPLTASNASRWLRPLVLFFLFLGLYTVTGSLHSGSDNFSAYPLGCDPPWYLRVLRSPKPPDLQVCAKHPLTMGYCRLAKTIAAPLIGIGAERMACTFPFSLIGALNIVVAFFLFSRLSGRHGFLLAAIYGVSSAIWFFSAFPESYGITTLLVSLYICLLVHFHDQWTLGRMLVMTVILVLGTLNEIVFPAVLVIPAVLYHRRLFKRPALLLFSSHVILGVMVSTAALSLILPIASHMTLSAHLSNIFQDQHSFSQEQGDPYPARLPQVAANTLCFNMIFPTARVDYESKLFPGYVGYFSPTLLHYARDRWTTLPFLMYVILSVFGLIRSIMHRDLVMGGLAAFVVTRMLLISQFNPLESFLYSSVMTLPLLAVGVASAANGMSKRTAWMLPALLITMGASNVRFFLAMM